MNPALLGYSSSFILDLIWTDEVEVESILPVSFFLLAGGEGRGAFFFLSVKLPS